MNPLTSVAGCRSRKIVESEETAAEAEKLDRENEAAGWANTVRTSTLTHPVRG